MGIIKRFYAKELVLGCLSQNKYFISLALELGIKPPSRPIPLASWWDMVIIEMFCVSRMDINALTMVYEGGVGYMIYISVQGVIIFGL